MGDPPAEEVETLGFQLRQAHVEGEPFLEPLLGDLRRHVLDIGRQEVSDELLMLLHGSVRQLGERGSGSDVGLEGDTDAQSEGDKEHGGRTDSESLDPAPSAPGASPLAEAAQERGDALADGLRRRVR